MIAEDRPSVHASKLPHDFEVRRGQFGARRDAFPVARHLARQQHPEIGLEEFFALDEAFHQGLLKLSGHGNAWTTVASAKGHLDRGRHPGGTHRDAATPHLRAVFEDVERIRERSPELFSADPDSVPTRRNVVVWE